jgi:hypothetical protein
MRLHASSVECALCCLLCVLRVQSFMRIEAIEPCRLLAWDGPALRTLLAKQSSSLEQRVEFVLTSNVVEWCRSFSRMHSARYATRGLGWTLEAAKAAADKAADAAAAAAATSAAAVAASTATEEVGEEEEAAAPAASVAKTAEETAMAVAAAAAEAAAAKTAEEAAAAKAAEVAVAASNVVTLPGSKPGDEYGQ